MGFIFLLPHGDLDSQVPEVTPKTSHEPSKPLSSFLPKYGILISWLSRDSLGLTLSLFITSKHTGQQIYL